MQYKLNGQISPNKFVNDIDGVVAPTNYRRPTVRPNPKISLTSTTPSLQINNSNILPNASKKAMGLLENQAQNPKLVNQTINVPFKNPAPQVAKVLVPSNLATEDAQIHEAVTPTVTPVNYVKNKKRRRFISLFKFTRPRLLSWDEFKVFSSGSLLALGMISFGFYLGFNRPLTGARSVPKNDTASVTTSADPVTEVKPITVATEDGHKVEVSEGVNPNKVDRRPPAPVNPESPKRFRIPSLKINAPIRNVGLLKDGAIAVPNYLGQVGWYDNSSLPGKDGTVLMVGHYDAYDNSVVFKRLKDVQVGAEINIERGDGQIVTYIVQNKASYDRNAVPMEQVNRSDNTKRLNIITCDGQYLNKEKTYSHRLVVYAVLK